MTRSILVFLFALAVGLSVGYLMGSARETPVRSDRPVVETRLAPEPLSEDATELAGVLHELPVPQYPAGTGRISGHVRDKEGNGVAGVTIRAQQRGVSNRPRKGGGVPEEDTLEEEVRKAVKRYHWRRQTTVDVVTDASGAYVLDGLTDRGYRLQAYLEGHQIRAKRSEGVWDVKPGTTIDWTASPVVTVPVDVLLPDGTRPTQAWIQCKLGNHSSSEHWSPERREIRVPPGAYTFSVSLSGDQGYRSEAVAANLEEGAPADPIVFHLIGRPGIRGWVRLRIPERFANLNVYALRFGGDETPSDEELGSKGRQSWVRERNGFEFNFTDLPSGRYLVGVGTRKGTMLSTTTIEVGDQMASTELFVDQIDPSYYVVVRVFGPDGEPAVVEQVGTSYRFKGGSSSGGSTWARREDGSYAVFHHDHNFDAGGTYEVELISSKYGSKSIRYELGKEREFEVRYREPARLEVSVSGFADSEHLDRVTIGLRAQVREGRWSTVTRRPKPDGSGRVVLGPVESGEYELVVYVDLGRHDHVPALRRKITLPAGESDVTIPMPQLHDLVVRGEKDQPFDLRADRDAGHWFQMTEECGDDGRAVFKALPAGRYILRHISKGEMTVTVPCGEVVFQESEYNAMKVSIRDANGMLAKAGLADGDLVVGIGGQEFTSKRQMQMLFAAAMMSGQDASLTIIRSGRTLELTVDLKATMKNADAGPGGSVRPTTR